MWGLPAPRSDRQLPIPLRGEYRVVVTYSNENAKDLPGDWVGIVVDGVEVGRFSAADTNDWNAFADSPPIALGLLTPGMHQLSFALVTTDCVDGTCYGIDLDKFAVTLVRADSQSCLSPDPTRDGLVQPLTR